MPIKLSVSKAVLMLAAMLLHGASHAQIFKWVDQEGKTHYSSHMHGAGLASVDAVVHTPGWAKVQAAADASALQWQARERDFQRRQTGRVDDAVEAARPKRLSTGYGSNQIDTDKAKCDLARDILSGAVAHRTGAVIDANDRQIAERDVKAFCR